MRNTVASHEHTAEAASLNDDASQECNRAPAIPINVISHLVLPFIQERRTWNAVCSANTTRQDMCGPKDDKFRVGLVGLERRKIEGSGRLQQRVL